MEIVLIDNNDSFTANLEHLMAECTRSRIQVVPYSRIRSVDPWVYDLAVISAGPGKPSEYPDYGPILECGVPILGICLGMQIINEHFGGTTARAQHCVHGKTDHVLLDGQAFVIARYHSLYLRSIAECLEMIAVSGDGLPMIIRHKARRIMGYQFHPESFMTQNGRFFIDYAVGFLEANRTPGVPRYGGDSRATLRR